MLTILSPNRYPGRISPVRYVVIHTMEVDENDPNVAEAVARVFATPARQASAHVCVDTDSAVRCVADEDTAWAAPGANAAGLQIELAGRAGQTTADWQDAASQAVLARAAGVCADWVAKFGIPLRHLSVAELAAGTTKGFIGHVDASQAFHASDHWDPGTGFPWDQFLAMVAAAAGTTPAQPPVPVPAVEPHIDEDGIRGPVTIGRWQQVMGTPVDKTISTPRSTLIEHDQAYLNSVVASSHIQDLTGKPALEVDGDEGPLTIVVRQFWLYNTQAQAVLGRGPRTSDFDRDAGPETTRLHQHALNLAHTASGRY
ncbi:MAG: N-acetylmuramoyl-L-alanine amidase [Cellulomonas sp.]|uniref:N-acetylmuramoyl-L-alanine amidase n=1 Tax=Cellulomonas sp. 73-92 TaxID=1895740 RepID=UPI00092A78D4|nr:N-acetylmuramoyl-L-alanine amidase [Cellulomonas sp. 73-92]MBN9376313.1 N-acetylmuramoyl-L-alanine amidase [Cellulomonas sp.]OJV76515.1 MAG: hypothetical protein BGO37_10685 [Cellulomonas sp. 73-92]